MFGKSRKGSCGAVIVAAGSGKRMKLDSDRATAGVNKVFLQAGGMPVLAHTLLAFEKCRVIGEIAIVTREGDIPLCRQLAGEFGITKLRSIVRGGNTRQQSVRIGLEELRGVCDFAAIHDGARCLINSEDIERVVEAAFEHGAASLGIRCSDSLKRVDDRGKITSDIDRTGVYRVQTPQVFNVEQIIAAHDKAENDGFEATDDCAVAAHNGIGVMMVEGSALNIKLTTQDELELVRAILENKI